MTGHETGLEGTDEGVGTTRPGSGEQTRGRAVYDRWSDHSRVYRAVMKLTQPMRDDSFEVLALDKGASVLDLGCGPGTNFGRLRSEVGESGRVVGLDYSRGMVSRARARVRSEGWSNVEVIRADATDPCLESERFDAVLTTFALHTMEDVTAVVENVHAQLRPGGRFVALDSRPIQRWPARLLNPVFERVIARLVNHQPDEDPLSALQATFETVEVVETYDAGAGYLALAQKAAR